LYSAEFLQNPQRLRKRSDDPRLGSQFRKRSKMLAETKLADVESHLSQAVMRLSPGSGHVPRHGIHSQNIKIAPQAMAVRNTVGYRHLRNAWYRQFLPP